MIQLTFNSTDEKVVAALRKAGPTLKAALVQKMRWLMLKLVAKIQQEYLSGQVLHQRSGKLIGSIRELPIEVTADTITGKVQGGGGPAWYGIVHEYGSKGPYPIKPVNKKALAFFPSGSSGLMITKTDLRAMYTGPMSNRSLKPSKYGQFGGLGGIVVKGVMHPALPKRPFMEPALDAMAAEIHMELQKSLDDLVASGQF